MSAKRKKDPKQTELPIDGAQPPTATERNRAGGKAKANGEGNGESHVLAEEVPAIAHHPFSPGKQDQALHRRVNTSFLEYASYVIRDRAIPALRDGLKPVQRRILWALHEKDDGRFIKVANVVGHTMQY